MGDKPKRKMEELLRRAVGPGPKYPLPNTIGTTRRDPRLKWSPAFSLGIRLKLINENSSPGPKYYIESSCTNHGNAKPRAFTFYGRARQTPEPMAPGPGHYSTENFRPLRERRAPSHSFGLRSRYNRQNICPAPNAYSLPVTIGSHVVGMKSAPSHSLNGRPRRGGFSEDLKKTPGPGSYNIVHPNIYQKQQPRYSIKGRNFMPGDSTKKPGPGVYSPYQAPKMCPPRFSFGQRHAHHVIIAL